MCGNCKEARKMLDKKKIKYEYISVSVQLATRLLITKLPVLEINGVKYIGSFNVFRKIKEL